MSIKPPGPGRSLLLAAGLFAVLSFAVHPATGAVTEAWVQRYSTMTGRSNDKAVKAVRDAAGDVIVAGNSDEGTSGSDFLTIKYSGVNGAVLWQRRYDNPAGGSNNEDRVNALVADAGGNVIVTGITYTAGQGFNWYTAKYAAADGALIWEKSCHNASNDLPRALAADASGNVTVTGYSSNGNFYSVITTKYAAADGRVLWQKSVGGPELTWDPVPVMALDPGGNVFVAVQAVTGHNESGFPYRGCHVVKYATGDGGMLWEKRTNTFAGGTALSVDSSGNVVLGFARTVDESGEFFHYYLLKRAAADGAILWTKGILNEETGGDDFLAMALDASGNVALARPVVIPVPDHPSRIDYVTAKYAAADGALIWEKPFNSTGNFDVVRALSVDAGGHVTVTGTTSHFTAADGNHNDLYTARYAAADGALVWEKQHHGGPETSIDAARAVSVMSNGDAVVTGTANNGSQFGNDFYTARYAAGDGALIWGMSYDGPANSEDFAHAVAMDSAGNVIVAGTPATIKYRADGTVAWTRPGGAGMLAVDATGNVVVTGMGTVKYRADGATAWSIPDSMKVMTLDAAGNVFHAGDTSDARHPGHSRAKYAAADGALLWKISHNGPSNAYFSATAAAVDTAGNLIVTGTTGSTDDGLDYYTAKYAGSNGALLWEKRFDGVRANDVATAVALDGSGNVVVTGYSKNGWDDPFNYSDSDYHTIKYAAADGALIWQKRFDSFDFGDDRANVVAVDAAGNVVVTGSSAEGAGEWYGPTVSYTAKYAAANGALIWEKRDFGGAASAMALDSAGNVVITGTNGRNESYTYAAGTNFYTAKYAAADGSFLWRRDSPRPGAYHFQGFWDLSFPIPKGDGNSHSLALGPNGKVAVTGSSDGNSGPDAIFDYETIVYQEVAGPVSFAAWTASLGLGNSDHGAADDPDHDGLPNAVEYVLGENPLVPAASGRPTATLSGDSMLFTFSRNDASETPDVYLTIETSTDLTTWSTGVLSWPASFFIGQNTATSGMGVTIAENGSAPDTVTVAIPVGPNKAKFARLRIQLIP